MHVPHMRVTTPIAIISRVAVNRTRDWPCVLLQRCLSLRRERLLEGPKQRGERRRRPVYLGRFKLKLRNVKDPRILRDSFSADLCK